MAPCHPKNIKEDPVLKVLPVAIFSPLITPAQEHKGKSVGADAQFAKPELQSVSNSMLALIKGRSAAAV